MTGKKHFNDLAKRLKKLGYVEAPERANRGNDIVFVSPDGHRVAASPGIHEHAARAIARAAEERLGATKRAPKRSTKAFRKRQAVEREQLRAEAERLGGC